MQTYALTKPGLWTGLDEWTHRTCVDAVVTEMQTQRYSAKSICYLVQIARDYVAWRNGAFGDAAPQWEEIDDFVAHRLAASRLRNGQRKALYRLRQAMVTAGAMAAPTAPSGPAYDLSARFEADLIRRGFRPASVRSYIFFCRPFLNETWAEGGN